MYISGTCSNYGSNVLFSFEIRKIYTDIYQMWRLRYNNFVVLAQKVWRDNGVWILPSKLREFFLEKERWPCNCYWPFGFMLRNYVIATEEHNEYNLHIWLYLPSFGFFCWMFMLCSILRKYANNKIIKKIFGIIHYSYLRFVWTLTYWYSKNSIFFFLIKR